MKKVFLSSTFRDLENWRRAVDTALRKSERYLCLRMEDWGAEDIGAYDKCMKMVSECDLYLGIFGPNYGTIYKSQDKSFTECEYDMAVKLEKPRLVFLSDRDFKLPYSLREEDDRHKRQKAFREKASDDWLKEIFVSPEDLALKVVTALLKRETAHTDKGEVKSDARPHIEYGHKYLLEPNFTGRVAERKMMSDWFRGDQPVFVLEAMGGFGKSALTWVWMHSDLMNEPSPGVPACTEKSCAIPEDSRPEVAFWWSFYEPKASFSSFLNNALEVVSRGEIDPKSIESDYEKTVKLLALLKSRKVLLVFDGFERELREYKRINPEYSEGKDSEEDKFLDEFSCISSSARSFIKDFVATSGNSRILMTTRHFPTELRSRDRKSLPGCKHEELLELKDDDAFQFFHAQGVKCQHAEFQQHCKKYGYHPLTLRLLSGMVMDDPECAGDIKVMERYDPIPKLVAREHHVIGLAYDALAEKQQQLLSRIAAFRAPMPYDVVKLVSNLDSELDLKNALHILELRGLLRHDKIQQKYDFHPLVKKFAYNRLTNREEVHSTLISYYVPLAENVPYEVRVLDNLAPTVELYHHTICAGYYETAFGLYYERLSNPLLFWFCEYDLIIELLIAFFPSGLGSLPRLKRADTQAYIMSDLAGAINYTGQPRYASSFVRTAADLTFQKRRYDVSAILLLNLSQCYLRMGKIRESTWTIRLAADRLDMSRPGRDSKSMHHIYGKVASCQGLYEEAECEFLSVFSQYEKQGDVQGQLIIRCEQASVAFFKGDNSRSLEIATAALESSESETIARDLYKRDRVHVEWLVGRSKTALSDEKQTRKVELLNEAEQHLTAALNRCREINLIEFEPDILLAWARWHRAKGNPAEARKYCDEALEIADRCEYRLCQADIHNFIALLELEANNLPNAKLHAEIGKERAYCDGPPYHYKPAYEESERLLKQIAAHGK